MALDLKTLPEAARLRYERARRQAMEQVQDATKAAEMAERSLEYAGWSQTPGGTWFTKARFTVRGDRWSVNIPIVQKSVAQQLAFGWASVIVRKDGSIIIDHQDDIIRVHQLERAAYSYVMESGQASDMHIRSGVAKLVESCVFTPEKRLAMGLAIDSGPTGWWTGFKVLDADVWAKVEAGEYAEFSIEGRAIRRPVEVDDGVA